jgi:hypothetical protein
MNFALPAALYLLLLLPLIALLVRSARQRRRRRVPSLVIWKHRRERQRHERWEYRLSPNLLLALQLAAAAALILALAGPSIVTAPSARARRSVLVMDISASMQAREGRASRFSLAREAALRSLDELPPESPIAVVTLRRRPEVLLRFTTDRSRSEGVLRRLEPLDEEGDAEGALELALRLTEQDPEAQILLFSDFAYPAPAPRLLRRVRTIPALSPPDASGGGAGGGSNVGITRFALRARGGGLRELQIGITFSDDWAAEVSLELEIGGSTRREMLSPPTAREGSQRELNRFYTVSAEPGVSLRAVLHVEDALEADNRAYGIVPDPPRLKVLCVTEGNLFLERFLAIFPAAEAYISSVPGSLASYDAIIFDRTPPPDTMPPVPYLHFPGVSASRNPGPRQAPVGSTAMWWSETHPVTAGLDLHGFTLFHPPGESAPSRVPSELQKSTLIRSSAGEAAVAYTPRAAGSGSLEEEAGSAEGGSAPRSGSMLPARRLIYRFDPVQSDLVYSPAYPLLLSRSLWWLATGFVPGEEAAFSAGLPVELPAPGVSGSVAVRTPAGTLAAGNATEGRFLFRSAGKRGIYRPLDPGIASFAINLTSALESELAPRAYPYAASSDGRGAPSQAAAADPAAPLAPADPAASETRHRPFSLRPLLSLAALLLLCAEWYLRRRRWS